MNYQEFKDFAEAYVEQAVKEYQIQLEQLTEKQLVEAICQAIAAGDFQRHIARVSSDPAMSIRQQVVYIPFYELDRALAKIEELEKQVKDLEDELSPWRTKE